MLKRVSNDPPRVFTVYPKYLIMVKAAKYSWESTAFLLSKHLPRFLSCMHCKPNGVWDISGRHKGLRTASPYLAGVQVQRTGSVKSTYNAFQGSSFEKF